MTGLRIENFKIITGNKLIKQPGENNMGIDKA